MGLLDELWPKLKPRIVGLIQEVQAQSVGAHDLAGKLHTGTIADSQGPQFLKTDGSRTLTGNQTVADGITFDGVDVSAHKAATDTHAAATAAAGHAGGVGAHTHQSAAQGGQLDHGAALTGLGDDDHPQYLNITRHDTPNRHTLGTVVPHDTHALLGGLSADDHPQYLLVDGSRPMSGSLIPSLTDTYDLGSSSKLWRKGWLSELDAVLFAKNTATLVGGWLIVGKNEGTLAADVATTDTQIDFGQAMTTGDFLLFRAAGAVEYMQIGTLVSGTIYNVTRNLDGSGANAWAMGTPYAVLGQTGAGRIELNAYDTPRLSVLRQGVSYNAQTELIRIGDLNAWGDYSSEIYGAAFGDYASAGANITIDPTNGIRLRRGTTDVIKLTSTEAIIKSVLKMPETASAITIGATPPTSSSAGTGLWIDRTGLFSLASNVRQAWIDATNGKLYAGGGDMWIDSDGITLPENANIEGYSGGPTAIKWVNGSYETTNIQAYSSTILNLNTLRIEALYENVPTNGGDGVVEIRTWSTTSTPANGIASLATFNAGGLSITGLYGGGAAITQDRAILRTLSSAPAYDSGGMTLFSKNNSLYALSQDNIKSCLGASTAALLTPLTWYGTNGLWLNKGTRGGVGYGMIDMVDGRHLSMSGTDAGNIVEVGGAGKSWYAAYERMNGTDRFWSRAVDGYICPTNWFTFGMWFYVHAATSTQGLMKWGSTTTSLSVYLYYNSATYTDKVLPGFEIYGTDGVRKYVDGPAWIGAGWHYIGGMFGYSDSSNYLFRIFLDGVWRNSSSVPSGALRSAVGNFYIGLGGVNAASSLLNGCVATDWIGGYNQRFVESDYHSTRAMFVD